jgi:hypothetical protein
LGAVLKPATFLPIVLQKRAGKRKRRPAFIGDGSPQSKGEIMQTAIKVGGQQIPLTRQDVIDEAPSCDTSNLDNDNVEHGVVVEKKLYCVTTLARHIAGNPQGDVIVKDLRDAFQSLGFKLWSKTK